ncbi:uncharacterized protein [Littorina saxatilis]|uniref:uncharacterized protein n=1 Tax=Littorina saxatilis TaxID=31220 RepID=UPI0038B64E6B
MFSSEAIMSRLALSSVVKDWATCRCLTKAAVSVSCFLMVINPLLVQCIATDTNSTSDANIKCMLKNDTTCPTHHCCVKKVITFRDPHKQPVIGTECQPLLTEGVMCLRNPEDYMCSCLPGMRCAMSKFETMGHCKPHG